MSYTPEYVRVNWQNEPNLNTPLNALNLNKMDYTIKKHDDTFANWDTTKANQSDLLLSVKEITYNSQTGVFVFTWQNGTTMQVDLNIEKIPVSFSMSQDGIITMTTTDGTQYTADIKTLITEYTFSDSAQIDFTVVDLSDWGSKEVGSLAFDMPSYVNIYNLDSKPLPDKVKVHIPTDEQGVTYYNMGISEINFQLGKSGGLISAVSIPFSPYVTDYELDLTSSTYSDVLNVRSVEIVCRQIDSSQMAEGTVILTGEYSQAQKQVTAIIKDGSITGSKLETNFLANCQAAQTGAEQAESDSEAWAKGTRNGTPVESTDPTYHNNAKYYSEQSVHTTFSSLTDVNISNLQNGQVPVYNSTTQKWENGAGGGGGDSTIYLTKAEYEALNPPVPGQLYGITDWSPESLVFINDGVIVANKTWSSTKINTELTNKHKITQKAVDITSGWTQDSTSQSGSTFYKKQITLNHIYVDSPTVEIGAYNAVLPTTAQQTTYDYLRYVTVDDTVPCIYLYADENMMSDSDRTSFYIDIEGAD